MDFDTEATFADPPYFMSVDIDLAVEQTADGKWIRERVPARVPDADTFELATSPMLVRGLAADDHICLDADGRFELLRWGRNLAVQVFGEWGEVDALAQHVASIGGRLDGKEPRMRVFTVPLSVGVYRIETTIDSVVAHWPKLQWMFGNLTELELHAGHDEAGELIVERVYAFEHPDDSFELVVSPLLTGGVASGDVVRPTSGGDVVVLARSGNRAVQAFGDWEVDFLAPVVRDLGGRLDGNAVGHVAAFTFPPTVDQAAISNLFDSQSSTANADTSGRTWRFSNAEVS